MQNLKIKVNNEAESREVQELLFELGLRFVDVEDVEYPQWLAATQPGGTFSNYSISKNIWHTCNPKEITLAELRDMAVLSRNNRTDANVEEENCLYDLYLTKSGDLYFYHCGKNKWILSNISGNESYYKSLKPIEKTMQEYLNTNTYEYKLAHSKPGGEWIIIPEGATHYAEDSNLGIKKQYFFRCPNDAMWVDSQWMRASFSVANQNVLWVRPTQPEALPFIDDNPQSLNEQYAEIEQVRQHKHYFKDVSNLNEIDVYMVLKLFNVTDPCLQHIVKKALCAGQRGHKDLECDLKDILDTAKRAVDINKTY